MAAVHYFSLSEKESHAIGCWKFVADCRQAERDPVRNAGVLTYWVRCAECSEAPYSNAWTSYAVAIDQQLGLKPHHSVFLRGKRLLGKLQGPSSSVQAYQWRKIFRTFS